MSKNGSNTEQTAPRMRRPCVPRNRQSEPPVEYGSWTGGWRVILNRASVPPRSLQSGGNGGCCPRVRRRVGECRGRRHVAHQGASAFPKGWGGCGGDHRSADPHPHLSGPEPCICLQMRQLTGQDFLDLENVKSVEMQSNALVKLPTDLLKRGLHLEEVCPLPPCPPTPPPPPTQTPYAAPEPLQNINDTH